MVVLFRNVDTLQLCVVVYIVVSDLLRVKVQFEVKITRTVHVVSLCMMLVLERPSHMYVCCFSSRMPFVFVLYFFLRRFSYISSSSVTPLVCMSYYIVFILQKIMDM